MHRPGAALARIVILGVPARGVLSMSTVAYDGVASPSALDSKQWLLSQPNGAYTTARTCYSGRRIFEWETHVQRTASSARAMLGEAAGGNAAALLAPASLRPKLDATVAAAVREYRAEHEVDELKVTVLVTWPSEACDGQEVLANDELAEGGGFHVACHVAPLPPLPTPPIRVEVRGSPRANALAKDSSWVSERAPLEELMRASYAPINELLLATEAGDLLEGSQTNFFAIQDGALHTAGEGILEGTVRRLLLEVCEREGIPVVLRPPSLPAAERWSGALISSTSRLLLPIDELYLPADGKPSAQADLKLKFDNGPHSLAARLRDLVRGEVEAHSTEIA